MIKEKKETLKETKEALKEKKEILKKKIDESQAIEKGKKGLFGVIYGRTAVISFCFCCRYLCCFWHTSICRIRGCSLTRYYGCLRLFW